MENDDKRVLDARHYNLTAHAIQTVSWQAKAWTEKAFERAEKNQFDGPHNCFAAQRNEENLYELKSFGLLYLLKNNAADFWGKDEFDYHKVRIPAGEDGYVAHTRWLKKPSQLKGVVLTKNNVQNLFMILDADYEYVDQYLNVPKSIRFLKELKNGHRPPRAGDQKCFDLVREQNNE